MAAGVYWRGSDGNIWIKDSLGVRTAGGGAGVVAPGDYRFGGQTYSEIDDPNPPTKKRASSPNVNTGGGSVYSSGGGSAGAPAPVRPSEAQLSPLYSSLESLDEILGNKNEQSRDEYGRAVKGYNEQDALDKRAHGQNVFQNENTFTSNNQAALLNAANASSGLRGVLSSLGALAGSGKNIVQKLVGLAANSDSGAARNTFETNATNVGQAWEQAEREQRQRREDAQATLSNNLQNNRANVLTSRQSIYEKLANIFGDDFSEGKTYASKAAGLTDDIARTTRASVAPYQKASRLFSPAKLQEYLAGTQNLNVDTSGGAAEAPINSPVYTANRRKDQLAGVA
jgi:hypothetical protein